MRRKRSHHQTGGAYVQVVDNGKRGIEMPGAQGGVLRGAWGSHFLQRFLIVASTPESSPAEDVSDAPIGSCWPTADCAATNGVHEDVLSHDHTHVGILNKRSHHHTTRHKCKSRDHQVRIALTHHPGAGRPMRGVVRRMGLETAAWVPLLLCTPTL